MNSVLWTAYQFSLAAVMISSGSVILVVCFLPFFMFTAFIESSALFSSGQDIAAMSDGSRLVTNDVFTFAPFAYSIPIPTQTAVPPLLMTLKQVMPGANRKYRMPFA